MFFCPCLVSSLPCLCFVLSLGGHSSVPDPHSYTTCCSFGTSTQSSPEVPAEFTKYGSVAHSIWHNLLLSCLLPAAENWVGATPVDEKGERSAADECTKLRVRTFLFFYLFSLPGVSPSWVANWKWDPQAQAGPRSVPQYRTCLEAHPVLSLLPILFLPITHPSSCSPRSSILTSRYLFSASSPPCVRIVFE